ncbi:DUF1430 domain-containing protein [Staphylococcus sp. 17KM0847]|uniref:DUF1430 domain-containing protein n=1 Tax=Staphylococcus sp. 17KM0847 TaxID=2583989 RepID=UPI0015DD4E3E|nr:DUF1430 domain-containing protein [Staphylococcus sp. 17KM0847]QLK86392.1 DUF1430 domain-containing protein [Staphylococcus sp. 17KM0847]
MKKILLVLAISISLVFTFIVIDYAKSLSFYYTVEKDKQKIELLFDDKVRPHTKKVLPYFEYLSKKYNVSITRATHFSDNKVIIHTTDQNLKQQADSHKNLHLFDHQYRIKVYNLKNSHLYDGGIYFLSGDDRNIQKVISLINKNVGVVEKQNNSFNYYLEIDSFSLIVSLLLIFIFFTVFLHYLQMQKENCKLLYDLGYSKKKLFFFLIANFKTHIYLYIFSTLIISFFTYTYIYNDLYFFYAIIITLCVNIAFIILCLFLIFITVIHYVRQYEKNLKQPNVFLTMYTYILLAIVAIIFLSLSTQNLIENYKSYKHQQESMKYWDITKHTYKTMLFDRGQVKDLELSKAVSKRFKKHYNSSYNHGFLIDAENFEVSEGIPPTYVLNEKENADIEPDCKTITIDKAYLKRHKIMNTHQQNVLDQMIDQDNTQNILVPIKFKKYARKIEYNFKDHFTFKKAIFSYKGKADNHLHIHIIWVDNRTEYFTYHSDIGGKRHTIKAPIAIVETGNTDALNFETYHSKKYAFESHLDDPYETIKEGLQKYDVEAYIPCIESIYNTKIDHIHKLQTNIYKYSTLALLTGFTFIMMIFTFIRLYFTAYAYNIFIRRHLGYSYFLIHRNILIFLLCLNVLMTVFLLLQYHFISYLVVSSVLTFEIIVSYYSFIALNKENVNHVLKGKKND